MEAEQRVAGTGASSVGILLKESAATTLDYRRHMRFIDGTAQHDNELQVAHVANAHIKQSICRYKERYMC